MTRQQIEAKIKTLKKQLEKANAKVKKLKSDMEELDDSYSACGKVRSNVENAIQEMLDSVKKKTETISSAKFKQYYYERVKSIMYGKDVSEALSLLSNASSGASRQYMDMESELTTAEGTVKKLKQEIKNLQQQLSESEDNQDE